MEKKNPLIKKSEMKSKTFMLMFIHTHSDEELFEFEEPKIEKLFVCHSSYCFG